MPIISFTKSAPEVASRPVDEGVTRPAHKPASNTGRICEEEEYEVGVSCADPRSVITGEDSVRIAACYGLKVVMPCELERPHHLSEGYVTLSETYLKFGVKFPLHPFFVEVLKYFGLIVF